MKKPQPAQPQPAQPAPAQPAQNPLADKIAELTNDLQRTRADFENFRKQIELREEAVKSNTKTATVLKMLPLVDNFALAIATYQELAPLAKTFEKTLAELICLFFRINIIIGYLFSFTLSMKRRKLIPQDRRQPYRQQIHRTYK